MPTFTYSGNQSEADRLTGTDGRPGDPIISRYSGQTCEVIRRLDATEVDDEVGPMCAVRFADGYEGDAFSDELDPRPCASCLHAAHWRECRGTTIGVISGDPIACECQHRGPSR